MAGPLCSCSMLRQRRRSNKMELAIATTRQRRTRTRTRMTTNPISGGHGGKIMGRQLFALSLFLLALVSAKGADSMVDVKTIDNIDPNAMAKELEDEVENGDVTREDEAAESDARFPSEDPIPLPASLIKAARVGAKIREVQNPQEEGKQSKDSDSASDESEMISPNSNSVEEVPHSPKPPLTGCHWGATGCNRGKGAPGGSVEANSSAIETDEDHESNGVKSHPSSSSLAGSASAKIEARVMKGRGPTLSQRRPATPPVWERDTVELDSKGSHGAGHKPPHGFKLAGRIVTSPSDGLSYFLESNLLPGQPEDHEIPYAYLECGPTIESTTEPFSLADMVLRHFPASASMSHWTNTAGGVTIESDSDEGDESEGPKYIEGNDQEGRPKLLIALSPIEITVSGNSEESRLFRPGDVILMEDTLGKGHKMTAARISSDPPPEKLDAHSQDMSVLMVSLPHAVHFPMYDWLEDEPYSDEGDDVEVPLTSSKSYPSSASPPTSYDAEDALFGFAPKHLHQKYRKLHGQSSQARSTKRPCPLEYDSAYSSLFMPTYNQHRRYRRSKRRNRWRDRHFTTESSFDEFYPPPPGFSTYAKHTVLFDFLPSLRRTMLFGLGISLTSSFIYCVQLLYPPLLVLWGGATMIVGGALMNVLLTRWGYRRFVANWEEEWRWKREVKRNKMHREELMQQLEDTILSDIDSQSNAEADSDTATNNDDSSSETESVKETKMAKKTGKGENANTVE